MNFRILMVLIFTMFSLNTFAYQTNTPLDFFQNTLNFGAQLSQPIQEPNRSLLERLFLITSEGQQVLGYDKARHLIMGQIYLEQDADTYFIKDVYCQKDFTDKDFENNSGIGPNQIPDSNVINVEHTWPQSRFTGQFPKETQKSDLHHLFPSDSEMNSKRANYKFAEISDNRIPVKCPISGFGKIKGDYRFEPPTVHKGHVARALFYFSVRYKIHIDADEESYLRKWNSEEPVDDKEISQHELIAKLQGNRNPFIDDSELANQVTDF